MAFSGQHAAVQLEKLDHSPLFRGYTFPLAKEVAECLGCVAPLIPPTILQSSRRLGRLACTSGRMTDFRLFLEELDGEEWVVTVIHYRLMSRSSGWIAAGMTGTIGEIRRSARGPISVSYTHLTLPTKA